MALASSSTALTGSGAGGPSWNPLKFPTNELPTELLVLIKVLALVVLLINHVRILPDPWLPFVPGIDRLPPLLFQRTLQTVFVVSALAILFNRRVRVASLLLGSTMLLAVVSSKAYYGNNKTFCGLMFFLTGLCTAESGAWPLRWQLGITYFGAGLNKALDPDWHSGVFFENWAVHRLRQPWYIALDGRLPPMWLARLMCWTTIFTELSVVPAIFIPRLYPIAVCANLLFQASLMLFTGTTFTLFFYSMSAASLAFVRWPAGQLAVRYARAAAIGKLRRIFQLLDADGRFCWTEMEGSSDQSWVELATAGRLYRNFQALRMMIMLNPLTWMAIAGLVAVAPDAGGVGGAATYRRVIVGASLVLLMPPLAWVLDTLTGRGGSAARGVVAETSGNPLAEA
jgi:hypothetical protein